MAALAHLSMTCLAPGLTLGADAFERRQALGIEAPSMARCGEFDLHQACGLLSADIVRRALRSTGVDAEFRLFIHDDHTDLESGLTRMRELYLNKDQTPPKDLPNSIWQAAASRIWTTHGARFVTRSTVADWRPVFEQALLLEWRRQVDWALERLAIEVSGWDSDAAVLREAGLFQSFENTLAAQQRLRASDAGSVEVLGAGVWYEWRSPRGEPTAFARDIVYQAIKLGREPKPWKNFWPASTGAYVDAVSDVLKSCGQAVARLSWPLRLAERDDLSREQRFSVAETVDVLAILRDESRSSARLSLLRLATGDSMSEALSWAHGRLALFRRWRMPELAMPSSREQCEAFLSSETPLEYLISMVNAPADRASFLTNMRFIKDVLGVAV